MRPAPAIIILMLALFAGLEPGIAAAQEGMSATVEFEGTIVPAREAEITPTVAGRLGRINFVPGQVVQEGDVLFEFDQTPQKLKVEKAEALLLRAQASLRNAEADLQRARKLASRDVVSQANLLEAEADRDIAAADVEAAKASLELEKFALTQLTQKAPFLGVMSAPLVKENGWHDPSNGDNITMATVTQLDPIYVVGEVPYAVFAERRKTFEADKVSKTGLILSIILPDGKTYPHDGRLVSGGHKFDEGTQKLAVWAEFANPDLLLRPGLKVMLRSRAPEH